MNRYNVMFGVKGDTSTTTSPISTPKKRNRYDVMFGTSKDPETTATVPRATSTDTSNRNRYDVMFGVEGKRPQVSITSGPDPSRADATWKKRLLSAAVSYIKGDVGEDVIKGVFKGIGTAGTSIFDTFLPESFEASEKTRKAGDSIMAPKAISQGAQDFIGDMARWTAIGIAAAPVMPLVGGFAASTGIGAGMSTVMGLAGSATTAGSLGAATSKKGQELEDFVIGAAGEPIGFAVGAVAKKALGALSKMQTVSKALDDLGVLPKDINVRGTNVQDKVKEAYRSMAMKYHPDRPGGSAEMFDAITKASNILKENPITTRIVGIARKFGLSPKQTIEAIVDEGRLLELPSPQKKVVQELKDDVERLGKNVQAQMAGATPEEAAISVLSPTATKAVRPSLPKMDDLSVEARKYKTAEEFVKAQGDTYYHGTSAKYDTKDFRGGYLTTDKNYADVYKNPSASSISYGSAGVKNKLSGEPRTLEFVLHKNAKIFDYTNPQHRKLLDDYWGKSSMSYDPVVGKSGQLDWTEGENIVEYFDEKGIKFDGIKLDEAGGIDPISGLEVKRSPSILIINPKVLKDTSQLTDIWNNANKEIVSPAVKETKVKEDIHPLVEQEMEYLKSESGKGVTPGYLIRDEVTGEVTGRVGRVSNNPQWYRDFFSTHGRGPNKGELRQIAEDRLLNGYTDDNYGYVEPNDEYVMYKFDQEMAQSARAPEPVVHSTDAQITETPKTSGLAKSIEQKGKDVGEVSRKGFDTLAQYGSTTLEGQENIFDELLSSGVENVRSVLRGESPLPQGMKGTALVENVERYLKKNPNVEMRYELANSPYTTEASEAGSSLSMLQNREKDSVTAKLASIRKAKENRAVKRGEYNVSKDVSREMKSAKKRVHLSKEELVWDSFIESIIC